MQNRDIEELKRELDDLGYLLQKAKEDRLLIPILKRQINHFIKSVEQLGDGLEQQTDHAVAAVMKEEVVVVKEETVFVKEETVIVEEERPAKEEPVVSATVLGERLRPAAELSKGLSLNDTFRFSRELFGGDKNEMNEVLQDISKMESLADVISYLSARIDWDEENEAIKDFIELLKKYFV